MHGGMGINILLREVIEIFLYYDEKDAVMGKWS